MATFLTTRRMAPELAARIEASIRGERGAARDATKARWRPLLVSIARFGAVAAVVAIVCTVAFLRRRDREELERSRSALLDTLRVARAALTPKDEGAVARVESWLERSSSGAYEGDLVADELRPAGALNAVLARPAVYVRGTMAQLAAPPGIAEAAAASLKDPLLVCLLEPPASRAEKLLLPKVHEAFSNAAEQHSATVRRFRDAQVGMPYLQPAWEERVRRAKTPEELDDLRRELERAPTERATRAVKAELLVLAVDEARGRGTRARRRSSTASAPILCGSGSWTSRRRRSSCGCESASTRAGSRPRSARSTRAGSMGVRWRSMSGRA